MKKTAFVVAALLALSVHAQALAPNLCINQDWPLLKCNGSLVPVALFDKKTGLTTPSDWTNPLPGTPLRFCLVSTASASGSIGWPDNKYSGIINLGATFGSNNGLTFYRYSSPSRSLWGARLYDNTGTTTDLSSTTGVSWPDGDSVNPVHQIAFCVNNGTYQFYKDGVATTSTGAFPTTVFTLAGGLNSMEIAGLGSSGGPYGAGNPLSDVCIAGPTGTSSATFSVAIANTCGQFTDTHDPLAVKFACYGCLRSTPPGNAIKVLAEGDSITQGGSSSPRPWPAALNTKLGPAYNVTNDGVNGSQISDMKTRYDASYHHVGMFNRCVFHGGINNIILGGMTGAATLTAAQALLDEMRTDLCNPIILVNTPFASWVGGWNSTLQGYLDTYRAGLVTYCGAHTTDSTCVDTYPTMGNGATPAALLTSMDSGDGLHPSQLGLDTMATLAKTAMVPAYSTNGPFSPSFTNATPVLATPSTFCMTITMGANGANGWTDGSTAGVMGVGAAFGSNNGLSMYRNSNNSLCVWNAKFYDSVGTTSLTQSNDSLSWPRGYCSAPVEQITYCVNNGHYSWWQNGVAGSTGAISTNYSLVNLQEIGAIGAGSLPYGSNDPISNACISNGTGVTNVDPTVAIRNDCGQFTNTASTLAAQYACYGCLGSTPTAGSTILAMGDTITQYGTGSPRPWPAKLNALLGATYVVTNEGNIGGSGAIANVKSYYDAHHHTANAFTRCILQPGGSDIILTGSTAAATYATTAALLDEMRADGCKPIVVLPTPTAGSSLSTSGRQTEWSSYKTSLSGYCTTNAATTTCINTDSMGTGSPLSLTATNASYEGYDPSQAGLDALATLIFSGATWP